MKNSTAAQKRWMEIVRDLGSVISGGPAVIHHCVGRTGMHDKVSIGHWWLLPLTDDEHKALHNGETFGYDRRKAFEKDEFCSMLWALGFDIELPPLNVCDAISGYHL